MEIESTTIVGSLTVEGSTERFYLLRRAVHPSAPPTAPLLSSSRVIWGS